MRSLKIERQPRGASRGKTVRPSTRGPRQLSEVQPGSSRRGKKPGLFSRLLRDAFAGLWHLLARPKAALAAGFILIVLIAALLVSGLPGRAYQGAKGALSAMAAHAGFGVYEIHITGNHRVPTGTIFAALGLKPGQSIFFVDLPAARARILALDWIGAADVVRRYPGAITVTVVEKRPFALWQIPGGKVAVVERSGGIITTDGIENFSKLPKLIGAGAPEAAANLIEAAMTHRAVSARVAAFERVSGRRWNLLLSDGVTVKLPENNWQKELDTLEHLIVDNSILERDVTEIDLRSPSQYFFVLKGGEKKDVERGKET
jgi:cell division protein FtsQ